MTNESKTIFCTNPRYSVYFMWTGEKYLAIAQIEDGESYGGASYWFSIGYYKSMKSAIRFANKQLAKHNLELAA